MWGSDQWDFMSRDWGRPVIQSETKLGRTPGKIPTEVTIMDNLGLSDCVLTHACFKLEQERFKMRC